MIKKITFRITDDNGYHVHFSLWVNGALICSPGGLVLRKEEFEPFIQRIDAIDDSEYFKS